ncbi:hypothetical protein Mgra_00007646 [Meloidogyne graminicola]|uniref:DUS-like FMN-binding domain-containing protein n=1 Tax=Meloidogyne graminicola TaxID=189291 RepID=A0A8S9ZHY6_9BILA|nr:hypothetical protein Mgra_00007646 [Meloidogyne graminicola]
MESVEIDEFEESSSSTTPLFIAAPMVRYSKLPFRRLVKKYNCNIVYTPMIYANCFVKSEKCRAVEFVPTEGITQLFNLLLNNLKILEMLQNWFMGWEVFN